MKGFHPVRQVLVEDDILKVLGYFLRFLRLPVAQIHIGDVLLLVDEHPSETRMPLRYFHKQVVASLPPVRAVPLAVLPAVPLAAIAVVLSGRRLGGHVNQGERKDAHYHCCNECKTRQSVLHCFPLLCAFVPTNVCIRCPQIQYELPSTCTSSAGRACF